MPVFKAPRQLGLCLQCVSQVGVYSMYHEGSHVGYGSSMLWLLYNINVTWLFSPVSAMVI